MNWSKIYFEAYGSGDDEPGYRCMCWIRKRNAWKLASVWVTSKLAESTVQDSWICGLQSHMSGKRVVKRFSEWREWGDECKNSFECNSWGKAKLQHRKSQLSSACGTLWGQLFAKKLPKSWNREQVSWHKLRVSRRVCVRGCDSVRVGVVLF